MAQNPVDKSLIDLINLALDRHVAHLETHKCRQCIKGYETVLKAITAWLERSSSNGKEKVPKNIFKDKIKEKKGGQEETDKEPWNIFK